MILRAKVLKGEWFVARDERTTFTITTNRAHALQFTTKADAEEFNARHMALGNITSPFDIV